LVAHNEALPQSGQLRDLAFEVYSARRRLSVEEPKGERAVTEVEDVSGLESHIQALSELAEPIEQPFVTMEHPAEVERLLARVELEFEVGRVADEHQLEVSAVEGCPAGNEGPPRAGAAEPRAGAEQTHGKRGQALVQTGETDHETLL
jgi:hypothetical protein